MDEDEYMQYEQDSRRDRDELMVPTDDEEERRLDIRDRVDDQKQAWQGNY